MNNNPYYFSFIRDFASYSWYSVYPNFKTLPLNRNENISYRNISMVVEDAACELVKNGKAKIYISKGTNEAKLKISTKDEGKSLANVELKFPKKIMSNFKRKIIVLKMKNMSNDFLLDVSNKNIDFVNFQYEKTNHKISKLTKDLDSSYLIGKFTDFYNVYRSVRKIKNQIILVDYILDSLNVKLKDKFGIDDVEKIKLEKKYSLEDLQTTEIELKENKISVQEAFSRIANI